MRFVTFALFSGDVAMLLGAFGALFHREIFEVVSYHRLFLVVLFAAVAVLAQSRITLVL